MLLDISYRFWIFCFKISIFLIGGDKILFYNIRNVNRSLIDNIIIVNIVFYFFIEVLVYKCFFLWIILVRMKKKSRM